MPMDWLTCLYSNRNETAYTKKCEDYINISLILKVCLYIIRERIYSNNVGQLKDTHFDFRNSLGTTETLFSRHVLK